MFNEDLSDKVINKQKLQVGVKSHCYLEEEHPMEQGTANTKLLREKQAWYVQETSIGLEFIRQRVVADRLSKVMGD